MSQPPQNGWGQPPSGDPAGQFSANSGNSGYDGYGDYGPGQQGAYGQEQQGGYGQPSPNAGFGQGPDASFAPSFGGDPGQGFAPQPPQKKSGAKVPILICAGCAVLALLLVIVGGGIFLLVRGGDGGPGAGGETTQEETTTEEQTSEETTTEEETSEEATTEEATTEEETSEEAPPAADGGGTKDEPYAVGETFTLNDGEGGTLDVAVGEVNWDATAAVMEASGANTEPGEGETYILVPLTVTYHGDDTAEPLLAVMIEYVSSTGNTYSDEGTLTPKSSFDVGTLHDGGTGDWEVGIVVPADQVKDGSLTVSSLFNWEDDPVWVAVK